MISRPCISAIFTAYNPDREIINKINNFTSFCENVIIIDNTPGGSHIQSNGKITVIQDGRNKGLGKALNIGISYAIELKSEYVILFDQDSSPSNDLIENIYKEYIKYNIRNLCLAPTLVDDVTKISYKNSKSTPSCLPTSGIFFKINEDFHNFSEDFFLDLVDFEWCWRSRANGWVMRQSNIATMEHRLGISEKRILSLKYHVPASYRHYFQFRDSLNLLSLPYVPFYSKLRFSLILIPKLIIYPFILDNGLDRLKWMLLGIKDYLLRKKGIGSAEVKLG